MSVLVVLLGLGVLLGFVLLSRVPTCPSSAPSSSESKASVIIPARNEERNLPRLLASLRASSLMPHEVIVVDDHSQDRTAELAAAEGARVVAARSLPPGWTGKTWACFQGAEIATGETLVFLDADTWFAPEGFTRLMSAYEAHGPATALSLLPFHKTHSLYEELSLFFNLLMAFGAGGFGALKNGRLFGQSLVISRSLYEASGGHAAVRRQILENVALAECVENAGGACFCLGGRGALNIRMFPHGFKQMWESWAKAFADGAAASESRILSLSVVWLSALSGVCLLLLLASGPYRIPAAGLYACSVLELCWLARQIGSFHWFTGAFYPVALIFFFVLFGYSLTRRTFKRQATWRGRQV